MTHRQKKITPFRVAGRSGYHIEFWDHNKRRRRALGTADPAEAQRLATELIGHLPVRQAKPHKQKSLNDPDMYIYFRKPYTVKVGSVTVGHAMTRSAARQMKEAYFAKH